MTNFDETIVSLITPPGEGAISVIRLSGKQAIEIVDSVFSVDLIQKPSHTVHYGYIKDGDKTLDEVLVTVFRAPRSFTTEDSVEVSCHGSIFIVQKVIELLIQKGARSAMRGEFTLRAFLKGRIDLSQAEAVADLISSSSEKAHEQALNQMRGGFSQDIKILRTKLIEFASLIELELDFGEEDVAFANRDELNILLNTLYKRITDLKSSFQLGNVIKNGVDTVIAGRPNAGKSTLLNALLNEDRAIVSNIAGTTRDTIEEILNIEGIAFRLIDTAGIRSSDDVLETIGVERTMQKIDTAALQVYVYDPTSMTQEEVEADIKAFNNQKAPLIIVANKSDIAKEQPFAFDTFSTVQLSAKDKTNISDLKNLFLAQIKAGKIQAGDSVVTNLRHYEALNLAQENLEEVMQGIENEMPSDLIAMDIRHTLHHLGTITGEISTDDLLESIFGNFCIGK